MTTPQNTHQLSVFLLIAVLMALLPACKAPTDIGPVGESADAMPSVFPNPDAGYEKNDAGLESDACVPAVVSCEFNQCGSIPTGCGGSNLSCGSCDDDLSCRDNRCQPSLCINGIQDSLEEGGDCGGSCAACLGASCVVSSDCSEGTCEGGICRRGSWTDAASMPAPRAGLALVTVGNEVFALGGDDDDGVVATVEVYRSDLDAWTVLSDMPTARRSHAAVVYGSKIYVMGGSNDSGVLRSVDVLDLESNTWSSGPELNTPRDGLEAVVGHDEKIYAIGGSNGSNGSNGSSQFEVFDGDSWTTGAFELTSERVGHAAAVAENGVIYVFGGQSSSEAYLATAEKMTPGETGWWTIQSLYSVFGGRTSHAMLAGEEGLVYVFGGSRATSDPFDGSAGFASRRTFVYDTNDNSWSRGASSRAAYTYAGASMLNDGRMILVGGVDVDRDSTGRVRIYTP